MDPHRKIIRSFGLLAAGLLASVAACETNGQAAETSIEEVRDQPAAYMGKVITVVGEVQEKYAGSGSFVIDGRGTWWDDNILVVVPREQGLVLDQGTEVRVTGEVMKLTITEIERDYDLDFETEIEVEYRDKPILMARNVTVIDRD